MAHTRDLYRCGYCAADLDFGTPQTLRHVVRHLGESSYLAAYHRWLELYGCDELSAHLLTARIAADLGNPR